MSTEQLEPKNGEQNLKRFPNNLSIDKSINIAGINYIMYKAYFSSLYDLHNYLKSNPIINEDIFNINDLASMTNNEEFAGKSYSWALEDLIKPFSKEFEEFLSLSRCLIPAQQVRLHRYVNEYEMVGGGPIDHQRFAAQDPNFYINRKRVSEPKHITLYVTLGYNCGTNQSQVWNRAVSISNIVRALENKGYIVDVEAFEMSQTDDEIANIRINLKQPNGKLDMVGLYKSLCQVEFLRRLLFRVLETLPVKRCWKKGYGDVVSEDMVRKYMNLDENILYFDQPKSFELEGKSLIEDFEKIIRKLELDKSVNLEEAKETYKLCKTLQR